MKHLCHNSTFLRFKGEAWELNQDLHLVSYGDRTYFQIITLKPAERLPRITIAINQPTDNPTSISRHSPSVDPQLAKQ